MIFSNPGTLGILLFHVSMKSAFDTGLNEELSSSTFNKAICSLLEMPSIDSILVPKKVALSRIRLPPSSASVSIKASST